MARTSKNFAYNIEHITSIDFRSDTRTSKKSLPHKKRISRKLKKNTSTSKKINKCNLCEQTFSTPEEFTQHQELCETTITPIHASPFACQLCSASFSDQLSFFGHLKAHYEPLNEENSAETAVKVLSLVVLHVIQYCPTLLAGRKNSRKTRAASAWAGQPVEFSFG